ncbi:MAG: hypothetical protein ABII09_12045 [Planctomycetota bacterium]
MTARIDPKKYRVIRIKIINQHSSITNLNYPLYAIRYPLRSY